MTQPISETGQHADIVDIYPTLSDLADLPRPNAAKRIDGVSLVPVLANPKARIRDHAYHIYPCGNRIGRTIRTDRYLLVQCSVQSDQELSPEFELYDYQEDQLERRNLALKRSEIVKRLSAKLDDYPDPVPRPQKR